MQTEQYFREVLDRYLAGTCTPEEKAAIEHWFARGGDPLLMDRQLSDADRLRLLENIHTYVQHTMPEQKDNSRLRGHVYALYRKWQVAAVWAGIIVLAGIGAWKTGLLQKLPGSEVAYIQVYTGQGEVKQIILPDSTVVWLNANSRLSYHPSFTTRRSLQLSGEALFDVRADDKHPFAVLTGDSVLTTVLGTSFTINSYATAAFTGITVLEGKVKVSKSQVVLGVLGRQQMISYNRQAAIATRSVNSHAADAASWIKGIWEYDPMHVQDLAWLLQNQYGITVTSRLAQADIHTKVSVNFSRQQQATEIAEIFCALAGCRYRMVNPQQMELY